VHRVEPVAHPTRELAAWGDGVVEGVHGDLDFIRESME
jgi:hypothetical protein